MLSEFLLIPDEIFRVGQETWGSNERLLNSLGDLGFEIPHTHGSITHPSFSAAKIFLFL